MTYYLDRGMEMYQSMRHSASDRVCLHASSIKLTQLRQVQMFGRQIQESNDSSTALEGGHQD